MDPCTFAIALSNPEHHLPQSTWPPAHFWGFFQWISISRGHHSKNPDLSDWSDHMALGINIDLWIIHTKLRPFPPQKKKKLPFAEIQNPPKKATGENPRQNLRYHQCSAVFSEHRKTAELEANLHSFFSREPRRGKWYSTWFFFAIYQSALVKVDHNDKRRIQHPLSSILFVFSWVAVGWCFFLQKVCDLFTKHHFLTIFLGISDNVLGICSHQFWPFNCSSTSSTHKKILAKLCRLNPLQTGLPI